MTDQVFVAREQELAQLQTFLDRALAGQGSVCFVTGEAGAGKTALVTEFARRAQAQHADLIVAIGDCNAQTGIGDPYLPFREVLAMLTGDVEARLAQGAITQENAGRLRGFLRVSGQALVDFGPDLVDIFVPGAALATRAGAFVAGKFGWTEQLQELTQRQARVGGESGLEQRHIFEQYTTVLKAMASEQPLALVVDDLQWVDADSISLLFHISRRIGESRILIVGAYRPDDVALGRGGERHPLEPMVNELKRYFGDVWVDLEQTQMAEGRQFVDAFLDIEPNRLGEAFRDALHRHAGGHPLFTIELIRDLQERSDLVQDEEGRWVEGPALDWGALPARVEGVIKERIGRLEKELQDILTVASVEGEDFTVQVIARVEKIRERHLLRTLSRELDKKHRLVSEHGSRQVGEQQLYLYHFRHSLFQQHLYNGLGEIERELLHGETAAVLEELHQGQTDEIAVQLAHHWVLAGEDEKAVGYMLTAGDQARAVYANTEAEQFYQASVKILRQQGQDELAARTLMKQGLVYTAAFEPEKAQRAYNEAFTLWEPLQKRRELLISPLPPAVLRFAVGEPVSLDPGKAYDSDSFFLQAQLFEGLVEIDPDQNVLPAIAARWEVADGGTKYVFYIREGTRWGDGTPVTAGQFEYAWKRNLDPATNSPAAHLLYNIQNARAFREGEINDPELVGVKALNDHILEIYLDGPTAYLPYLLAHPITYPLPDWVIETHQEAWTTPGNIVTNGAYELVEWRRGERLILRRNPFYHGRFPGNAERIECLVFTDFGLGLQAYAAHAIDMVDMTAADAGVMAQARASYGEELVFTPLLSTNYLIFRADRPPFNDVRIRRAFVHAVDREALTRQLSRGEYLPATGGFVPPGMPGHSPGIGLAYDPEAARRLLTEAGYPGGQGFPVVTWLHTHGLSDESFIPFLQEALRRNLGVTVEVTTLAWEPFLTQLDRDPPHLMLGGWIADYPDPDNFLRVVFHSTEGMNEPCWHNGRFDALVEEAAQVTVQSRRLALYHEADRILVAEEAAIMPFSYGRAPILVKSWVTRFSEQASYLRHLEDIVVERKEQ